MQAAGRKPAAFGEARAEARDALSVAQALAWANAAVGSMPLAIVGEVSEVTNRSGYSAVYFTVKDEDASLKCKKWKAKGTVPELPFKVGSTVLVQGTFDIWAKKCDLSFNVRKVSPVGEGYLRQLVAQLAARLRDEGLMAPARKRPVPVLPRTIGLVTSPNGAAVHDVLRTLKRRYPLARVLFAGVPVEGADAPARMQDGMRAVVAAGAEVVLLVRGGGSFEDLMPFNDEGLARTIARCPVPVVTGIGHEPDTSIADLVADVRASTPTAAAEAVSPAADELPLYLDRCAGRLASAMEGRIFALRRETERAAACPALRDPASLYARDLIRVDHMRAQLAGGLRRLPRAYDQRLLATGTALTPAFRACLARCAAAAEELNTRLGAAQEARLDEGWRSLELRAAQLDALSPLKTIARGFGIVADERGAILKSVSGVAPGDAIRVRLSDGALDCAVERVHPESARLGPEQPGSAHARPADAARPHPAHSAHPEYTESVHP